MTSSGGAALVLNCGSSSIKYTLYLLHDGSVLKHGVMDRVDDYDAALLRVLPDVEGSLTEGMADIGCVGHRVVHGGTRFSRPSLVTEDVRAVIREYSRFAPLHNPYNLKGIDHMLESLPDVPQVAVFDTAFFAGMPERSRTYALPSDLVRSLGIVRYGFHGISHQYVHRRALVMTGQKGPEGTAAITCHLGNGCSISAVRDGMCQDTSMGFTPLEGLVMGTRSGDMDPSIPLFLLSEEGGGMTAGEVTEILNRKSGLLGLSGRSHDVRDLVRAMEGGDRRAGLAVEVFSYRLKKYISAYHGVLGGADLLVFTAGIGENSALIRAQALEGLEDLGFRLDAEANERARGIEAEISAADSGVRILVIPTDEDRMILEETVRLLEGSQTV